MGKIVGITVLMFATLTLKSAHAASAEENFYRGKGIRIIVGFAAGGGFDAYARAIARHMGRHIPGNPSMIVDNMTGAGSRVSANFLFRAPADGLVIGNFIGSLVLQQIMGEKGIEFDGRKFEWLGGAGKGEDGFALAKKGGVNPFDERVARKEQIKLGGEAAG